MSASSEPLFLTVDDVLELHSMQIQRYGGTHGIRDAGALESAVAMPQSTFGGTFLHETVWEMAAAYAFHIAENQPFLDGNKRTALDAALTFLAFNGVEVEDPRGCLYDVMMAIAARDLDKTGLAAVLCDLAGVDP